MSKLADELHAVVVGVERSTYVASADDGARVQVHAAFCREQLVVGARIVLRRIRARPEGGLEASRAEIDEAHRAEYEALLFAELERDAIEAARAEATPPNAALEPGDARGVIVEDGTQRCVRLEDGTLARFHTGRLPFRALPGVEVIARGTVDKRGKLWVAEHGGIARLERDESHREAYERLVARERFERMRQEAAERRAARGEPVTDLPRQVPGRIVDVTKIIVFVELATGHRVEVARSDCASRAPVAGLAVIASRLFRRPDGALIAEELTVDEAIRAALDDVRRTRESGTAPADALLEAKLLEDPSDDATWIAYQAALAARGDPRAELMAIEREIELEGAGGDRLGKRRAFFDRHGAALLGPFADSEQAVDLEFVRGHVSSARVRPSTIPPDERVATLLALPSTRFVWTLAIEASDHEAFRSLSRARPPSLRRLEIGRRPDVPVRVDPGRLVDVLPRLRELVITGTPLRFDPKDYLRLARLEIRTTKLPHELLASLMQTEWPALEALVLWLGKSVRIEELAPLFEGAIVPRLVELGICNTTLTNRVCRALVKSPLLGRLRRIDLSRGTMTDGGAAAIGAAAPAFAAVESLDATASLLTPLGEGYLHMAVSSARTEGQRAGYGEGIREPAIVPSEGAT